MTSEIITPEMIQTIIGIILAAIAAYFGGNNLGTKAGQTTGYKQGKKEVEAKYTEAPKTEKVLDLDVNRADLGIGLGNGRFFRIWSGFGSNGGSPPIKQEDKFNVPMINRTVFYSVMPISPGSMVAGIFVDGILVNIDKIHINMQSKGNKVSFQAFSTTIDKNLIDGDEHILQIKLAIGGKWILEDYADYEIDWETESDLITITTN